jgi:hypothetical protein
MARVQPVQATSINNGKGTANQKSCSQAIMQSCSHAVMQLCNHEIMKSCKTLLLLLLSLTQQHHVSS